MSNLPDKREIACFKQCPDCGFKNMRVFTNGMFHCGKCLSAGMISCKSHRYLLKDKEIIKKVSNKRVFNKKVCECGAVIDVKEHCRYCGKDEEKAIDIIADMIQNSTEDRT